MKDIEQYNNFSASDYYDAVTIPKVPPAEAVYYLLQRRLKSALHRVFALHGMGLSDDFNDALDDYFLFLYEGVDGGEKPFSLIKSVQEKEAFFGWIVGTFRHFLTGKIREEAQRKDLLKQVRGMTEGEGKENGDGRGLGEDTMISFLASAIAYADQRFSPGNLFIFYRSLLSLLDHSRAIPQEEMAEAMKVHPVTYRVRCKRQRDNFQDFILSQETGHQLDLDRRHELMRLCIEDEFYRLYDLLIGYYNQVLEQLPVKSEVSALRMKYRQEKGLMMHESGSYGYRFNMKVDEFYKALKS